MIKATAAHFGPVRVTPALVFQLVAIWALAGCAGPVETRYGSAGPLPASATAVSILSVPVTDDGGPAAAVQAQARSAVVAELARRGIAIAPDSASRLELAITARGADSGVGIIGGADLSPAKKQRLLQSCLDTTYRLALALYAGTAPATVSRGWAEESHCHGRLDQSLPTLARHAVAALVEGSHGVAQRSGVD